MSDKLAHLVAAGLGRRWLGIEANPAYAELAKQRIGGGPLTAGTVQCVREEARP